MQSTFFIFPEKKKEKRKEEDEIHKQKQQNEVPYLVFLSKELMSRDAHILSL